MTLHLSPCFSLSLYFSTFNNLYIYLLFYLFPTGSLHLPSAFLLLSCSLSFAHPLSSTLFLITPSLLLPSLSLSLSL